jgi:hypothetical protein
MENKCIDARPALPTSESSLWDAATERCDKVYSIIDSELKNQNITAWIRKSKPGEYPLFVAVESWIQSENTENAVFLKRSFLKVIVLVEPCREYKFTYNVELERSGKQLISNYWKLADDELRELVKYLIQGGEKPKFFKSRISLIERFIGIFIPFFGKPPENELIPEARPNLFYTLVSILGGISGIIVGIIISAGILIALNEDNFPSELFQFLFVAFVVLVFAFVVVKKDREVVEVVPVQPLRSPRREFRIDSWHVSVPGAGQQFEQFKQRLHDVIRTKESNIEMGLELHQRLTPRGYEERERLVLTRGQTTLHVHVYPFATDAFVGWESYLNWNCWAETEPVSTTIKDGKKLNYRSLKVGGYIPTDFDLIEADVLAETTHRVIVDEIKSFLKEKEIEAELDFKIIRGDRTNALKEGKDGKQ